MTLIALPKARVVVLDQAPVDGRIALDPDAYRKLDWAAYSWDRVENACLEGKGEVPQARLLIEIQGAYYFHVGRYGVEEFFSAVRAYPRAEWKGKSERLYVPGDGIEGTLVAVGTQEFVLAHSGRECIRIVPETAVAA